MSTSQSKASMKGDLQLVPVNDKQMTVSSLPPKPPGSGGGSSSNAIVEYTRPLSQEEEEDLEIKLRRIIDNVPVRYRQMRRKEQDRLARIEVDYQRRKEVAEFEMRRDQRLKADEERTAKKRLKRQKKKQRKKEKRSKLNEAGDGNKDGGESSDGSEDLDNSEQGGGD